MTPTPTLDTWLEEERIVRKRLDAGAGPGVASAHHIAGKNGLEVMQGLLSGELPYASIAKTLDFLLVEVGPGTAIFQGSPGHSHLNPLGTVHGGWFATILDGAVGNAIHTLLPAGTGYTTLDLSVKMTRAIVPSPGARVRAIGKVIQVGRKIATAEGRIVGPDGKLYAHATTTCLILNHSKN